VLNAHKAASLAVTSQIIWGAGRNPLPPLYVAPCSDPFAPTAMFPIRLIPVSAIEAVEPGFRPSRARSRRGAGSERSMDQMCESIQPNRIRGNILRGVPKSRKGKRYA
jgi:hypothetical protein